MKLYKGRACPNCGIFEPPGTVVPAAGYLRCGACKVESPDRDWEEGYEEIGDIDMGATLRIEPYFNIPPEHMPDDARERLTPFCASFVPKPHRSPQEMKEAIEAGDDGKTFAWDPPKREDPSPFAGSVRFLTEYDTEVRGVLLGRHRGTLSTTISFYDEYLGEPYPPEEDGDD